MINFIALKIVLGECRDKLAYMTPGFCVANIRPRTMESRYLPIWLVSFSYDDFSAILFSPLPLPRFFSAVVHGYDNRSDVCPSDLNGAIITFYIDNERSLVTFILDNHEFRVPFSDLFDVIKHPDCIIDFLCPGENDGEGSE